MELFLLLEILERDEGLFLRRPSFLSARFRIYSIFSADRLAILKIYGRLCPTQPVRGQTDYLIHFLISNLSAKIYLFLLQTM